MTHLRMKVLPKALLAALVVTPFAFAQQAPAPQKVEKIEVTGSNIKRVDAEGSAPIQIISREEIESSGKQTVTELLRTLPTNAGGGLNDITGANSFSSGASTVSLRGLGSAATLVLLNGRRVAPFGPADPNFGQSGVVNLDALPLDVVDRIEILKDGASAIYGSEAVAGVVNIILRKDYTGAQIGGSISQNRDSEYRTTRASTTLGFGDLARDRYNVFMNYERVEREVTKVDDVLNYVLYPTLQTKGGGNRMGGGANLLLTRFMSVDVFKALYEEKVVEVYEKAFASGAMETQINEITAVVRSANEVRGFVDAQAYEQAVEKVMDFIARRGEFIAGTELVSAGT